MSYRLSDPALEAFTITPSNSVDLAVTPKSIYVGTGGDVVVVTEQGKTITFKNAQAGSYLLIRPKRINATGTTAADLVGLV